MRTLAKIYSDIVKEFPYHSDKGSSHSYISVYDSLFDSIKDNKMRVLEIGVEYGTSLIMWARYFKNSEVVGLDINTANVKYDVSPAKLIQGNSLDKSLNLGMFDLIIDDGGHDVETQANTILNMRDRLYPGGHYVIEDIFVENVKSLSNLLGKNTCVYDLRALKYRADDIVICSVK
jgi:SAM-dependent methyltransferase